MKQANKQKSAKYEGIRYKELSNGDICYYARFTKDGKQRELKIGTKSKGWSEKKAYQKKAELEKDDGDGGNQNTKFKEVIDRFLEIKKLRLREKSFIEYQGILKDFGALENKTISSITQSDINSIIIELSKKLKPSTINMRIAILKQILKFSELEFGAKVRNFKEIKNIKSDNKRERFLTKEEILLLKESVKNDYDNLLFVNLALSTGARLVTILNIKKKDIDLENRAIALRDFKNSSYYKGFINDESANLILKRWGDLNDNDSIIKKNKYTLQAHISAVLNRLFNQDKPDNKHKVVIHSLRHTFASHLAIQGVSIQIIQKLLNHRDITMTMRYSHLMPNSGKDYVMNLWS
ncbi:hypothetical protein BKH46_07505 [Helicobacter sp. 12S02634-8]|uniref:tyrosine-type recombinase/integrase n=1 Tax=Helicobacter sp. 12S02634-8 TaxID=1476199 RepID=UPI000BA6BE98|nr:site-specific integrase [Helicobacter sp. 12S02634-8]PAF46427.1 hypothetical protein BKH46_07505 [Helicobacter sp. 12S02634-8]